MGFCWVCWVCWVFWVWLVKIRQICKPGGGQPTPTIPPLPTPLNGHPTEAVSRLVHMLPASPVKCHPVENRSKPSSDTISSTAISWDTMRLGWNIELWFNLSTRRASRTLITVTKHGRYLSRLTTSHQQNIATICRVTQSHRKSLLSP